MKILVISDVGTLGMLHDQALLDKSISCVDKNALLFDRDSPNCWSNIPDEPIQVCFGYHYKDLPDCDSRFVGKEDCFDFLVEIGSEKMRFLAAGDKYVNLLACNSITKVVEAVKNGDKDSEDSTNDSTDSVSTETERHCSSGEICESGESES